jgi:eukaryotic-like serine/threonine-protein kinase
LPRLIVSCNGLASRRRRCDASGVLQAGDIIAQHFRLLRQLGSGGMGSVWVAEHIRLGGHVAVKFLSNNLLDHQAARARFDKEAKWVAKIRSPHVVQVHDHGVTGGDSPVPYIVMELLDGEDLANRIEREGPLSMYQTSEILDQVCDALTKAHQVGIVHRDVKPENVFVLESKRTFVKLLDFGVAHGDEGQLDRLTQTGLLLGTAHYMSPEQLFSGKDIDHRADLWALGVLTYQMLTARLPFHGETFGSLCLNVRDGQFPPVSKLARVPVQLDAWFEQALALDRTKRFQSAAEMTVSFQQAMATTAAQFDAAALPGGTLAVSSVTAVSGQEASASAPHNPQRLNTPGLIPETGGGRSESEHERLFGGTLSTDAKGVLAVEALPQAGQRPPRRGVMLGAAVVTLVVGVGAWRVASVSDPTVAAGAGAESSLAPPVAAAPEKVAPPDPNPRAAEPPAAELAPEPSQAQGPQNVSPSPAADAVDPQSSAVSASHGLKGMPRTSPAGSPNATPPRPSSAPRQITAPDRMAAPPKTAPRQPSRPPAPSSQPASVPKYRGF